MFRIFVRHFLWMGCQFASGTISGVAVYSVTSFFTFINLLSWEECKIPLLMQCHSDSASLSHNFHFRKSFMIQNIWIYVLFVCCTMFIYSLILVSFDLGLKPSGTLSCIIFFLDWSTTHPCLPFSLQRSGRLKSWRFIWGGWTPQISFKNLLYSQRCILCMPSIRRLESYYIEMSPR